MKGLLRRIKPLCFCLVLALMIYGLWSLRGKLADALTGANWLYLAGAAGISLVYLALNASVWGVICRLFGVEVSRWKVGALWVECESMRWLPGGIWGYASRVVEAKRIGLNKTNGGLSLAIELFITVVAWGILGLVGILFSSRLREVLDVYLEKLPVPVWTLGAALVLGGMILLGVWIKDVCSLRSKFLKMTADLRKGLLLDWTLTLRALGEYLGLSVFYSLGFLLCIKGIHVTPLPSLLEAGGAYGVAWIIGLVAIGAPGGMGVREGFLFLVFQPLGIGAEIATAAILWRAIQILTEFLLLLIVKSLKLAP